MTRNRVLLGLSGVFGILAILACSTQQDLGADVDGGADPSNVDSGGADGGASLPGQNEGGGGMTDAGGPKDGSTPPREAGAFDATSAVNVPATCAAALGLQVGSSWPTSGHCPSRQGRSAVAGPATLPTVKWSSGAAANVIGQPVIAADGTLYAVTNEQTLWAVHADGTPKWSYALPIGEGWVNSTPTLGSDGTIYIGNSLGFLALNPDKTVKWTIAAPFNEWASDGVVDDAGVVYFASSDGLLHAINPNGTPKWAPILIMRQGVIIASPALGADGILYVSDGTGLNAIDRTGAIGWTRPLEGAWTPVVGTDGRIYVISADDTLHAFDANGTEAWSVTITAGIESEMPAVAGDGTIYIAGGDGQVHAYTPAGAVKWTAPVADKPSSGIIVGGDGSVYVTTKAAVVAFSSTGTQSWTFPVSKARSLAIAGDGTLVVGADQLRALGD